MGQPRSLWDDHSWYYLLVPIYLSSNKTRSTTIEFPGLSISNVCLIIMHLHGCKYGLIFRDDSASYLYTKPAGDFSNGCRITAYAWGNLNGLYVTIDREAV